MLLLITIRTIQLISYAILTTESHLPSSSSRLTIIKHTTIKVSPSTQSIHSCTRKKPSSYTQIHSCYYYQDLHILPLHTRSRKPFNRIIPPSYKTKVQWFSRTNFIPSIFSNVRFGRYVVTRFLADANFHGHRPTVTIKPSDSYYLCLDRLSQY